MALVDAAAGPTLSDLPYEVLELIMTSVDDLPALHAFVTADLRAKLLFKSRPYKTFFQVLRSSSMPHHAQELLCIILCIRQDQSYMDFKTVDSYLSLNFGWKSSGPCVAHHDSQTQDEQSPFPHLGSSSLQFDAIEILQDAATICKQVAEAEESFIRTQLPMTANRIQKYVHDRGYRKPVGCPLSGGLEPSPTLTERHRIRRALWRLWQYFELFCDYRRPLQSNEKTKDIDLHRRHIFFAPMTVWESAELVCAYLHIRHQSKLWRKPCPNCNKTFLPDLLYLHAGQCGQKPVVYVGTVSSFTHDINFMRNFIGGNDNVDHDYADSPPATNYANAGYAYIRDNALHSTCLGDIECRWSPVSELLDWGYCMWDRERLEAWHLISNVDRDVVAVPAWWYPSDSIFRGALD